jgi:hypothetical protein
MAVSGLISLSFLVLLAVLKIDLPNNEGAKLGGAALWDLINAYGISRQSDGWRKVGVVRAILGFGYALITLFGQTAQTVTTLGTGAYGLMYCISILAILLDPPSRTRIRLSIAGVIAAWVVGLASWALPPYVAALKEQEQILASSLPDRVVENRRVGYRISLPEGWTVLAKDNPILKAPDEGFVMADLDDKCYAMFVPKVDANTHDSSGAMAQRLARKEGDSTDAPFTSTEFMGRPGASLDRSFKSDGVPMRGVWTVTKRGWVYFALLAWYPELHERKAKPALSRLQNAFVITRPFADATLDGETLPAFMPKEALYPLAERVERENLTLAEYTFLVGRATSEGLTLLSASQQRTNNDLYSRAFSTLPQRERMVVAEYYSSVTKGTVGAPLQTQATALIKKAVGGLSSADQARLGDIATAAVQAWIAAHPSTAK